jgi:septum formation protein
MKKSKQEFSGADVILGSQSPRRRELLKKIVNDFRVVPSGIDEERFRERDPVEFALMMAVAKAKEISARYPASLVIAADTLVCLNEEIFGKPKSRAEARAMLRKLSGRRHRVVTAVALSRKEDDRLRTGHETSWVTFKRLSREDIEGYLQTKQYLDKAGSYAIQDAGDALVESLEGDYDNVVGLPVRLLRSLLDEFFDRGRSPKGHP